jgi:hypothetical protein
MKMQRSAPKTPGTPSREPDTPRVTISSDPSQVEVILQPSPEQHEYVRLRCGCAWIVEPHRLLQVAICPILARADANKKS